MDKPLVSVVMSVYNDERYLKEAVNSILNQSFKDFEFIIINDGSNDASLNILKEYEKKDKRIILIDQENIGLTKSLNKAIKLSHGKYIARQDSDDISDPERFKSQIEFLQNNKEYALVGTNIAKIDENSELIEINSTKYSYEEICQTFKKRNCIAHGSVMIDKGALENELFYDEDFRYAQDFRLWAKIAKKFKIANLKEPLYQLRLHGSSISKQKIESQSIYAGVVAYEFEYNTVINNIDKELENNKLLRKKVATVLLMNFNPDLALNYLQKTDMVYYLAFLMRYLNLKKIKSIIKKFR